LLQLKYKGIDFYFLPSCGNHFDTIPGIFFNDKTLIFIRIFPLSKFLGKKILVCLKFNCYL